MFQLPRGPHAARPRHPRPPGGRRPPRPPPGGPPDDPQDRRRRPPPGEPQQQAPPPREPPPHQEELPEEHAAAPQGAVQGPPQQDPGEQAHEQEPQQQSKFHNLFLSLSSCTIMYVCLICNFVAGRVLHPRRRQPPLEHPAAEPQGAAQDQRQQGPGEQAAHEQEPQRGSKFHKCFLCISS